jgi:uncharacterized protein (DUF924 family)
MQSKLHTLVRVANWNGDMKNAIGSHRWGMVLVDQAPRESRKPTIELFANNADALVVHDTQPEMDNEYHMAELLNTFEYRLDFATFTPHTTVVSNSLKINAHPCIVVRNGRLHMQTIGEGR